MWTLFSAPTRTATGWASWSATTSGEYQPVTGNQTGVLLLDYLIGAMKRAGTLPEHPVALKTIVTTEMARKVAESNGVACYDTFTGFKFMAEKKNALEAAGRGQGHLLLRGVLRLYAGGLRPGQGRCHRLPAAHGDGRVVL